MRVSNKQLFFTALSIIGVMFVYLERSIVAPFVLAAIFAYIFTPVVNALSKYLKLRKALAIALVYLILIALVGSIVALIAGRLFAEAKQISQANSIDQTAQDAINSLPDWNVSGINVGLKSSAEQLLGSAKQTASNYVTHAGPIFSGVLREGISLLVFFVAGFYLLRDWPRVKSYIKSLIPEEHKDDLRSVWARVNMVLGNYLRGQLILIAIMATASFIVLESLGVKYALTIAILTGFLEIIPYIGPITATAVAAGVAFLNGQNRFDLDPAILAFIVIGAYFVLRHLEDYLVIPMLYNRLTKLHPVVVIFSVLAGGHLFGVLGLVLAVPVAAATKIVLEYMLFSDTKAS